jgi:hydrogenase/urease accessory protein HupE
MNKRLAVATAILALAIPALAHRIDEYLQAATIDITRDRVALQLRLTPGVDVAKLVSTWIDTDANGALSPREQREYVQQLRRDLTLTIDNHPASLLAISWSFPRIGPMMDGTSDIVVNFETEIPRGRRTHNLVFENRHAGGISAYLVNALQPREHGIVVSRQRRTYDQSRYEVTFEAGDGSRSNTPETTTGAAILSTYVWHGVRHILTGYDHVLFLCALALAAATLWDLIKVVTAFTVAHSLTLTLAALDMVHLSPRVVEPVIAASIVFVAAQNVLWPAQSRRAGRLAVAFIFGLFHGLGFAGGLFDLMHHMPVQVILLAILGFSIGIEAGNQIILLPLFGLLKAARTFGDPISRIRFATALQRAGSAVISCAGIYYLASAAGFIP